MISFFGVIKMVKINFSVLKPSLKLNLWQRQGLPLQCASTYWVLIEQKQKLIQMKTIVNSVIFNVDLLHVMAYFYITLLILLPFLL